MSDKFIRPTELPDIETIKDILLEVEDTNLYKIEIVENPNFRYERFDFDKLDLGVKTCKYFDMVIDNNNLLVFNENEVLKDFVFDESYVSTSYARVVEYHYSIHRYVTAIVITSKNNDIIRDSSNELNEVIERIKSYLGNDLYSMKYVKHHLFIGMVLNVVKKV